MSESPFDVVCDAGPLIHLDELDCLDLLSDFRSVLVPEQIRREVEHHRAGLFRPSKMPFQFAPVEVSEDAAFSTMVRALALDLGEQAALSLMMHHPDAILLTDDAAARLAGEGLGYRVHGTIGVLLRAIRRRQRTAQETVAILHSMPARSSLHIRLDLLEEIIAEVELIRN
jgi:predicted nucleic acid-binding protein